MGKAFVPTLPLVILDFLPCILFLVAFIILLSYARRNTSKLLFFVMLLGVIIVEIGALSKVTWKLLNVVADMNVIELSNIGLYLIGLGTLLIFITVINITMREKAYITSITSTTYGLPFFLPMIIILTMSTCGYLICLIMLAESKKKLLSVAMFAIYLAVTLTLTGFTPVGKSMMVHWISEGINSLGTLALVIGAYTLNKADIQQKQSRKTAA